ncbi:restriction endonuclease subunit S [Ferrimicrobium acidiphilum]|uniref:restriction endonuclease subunit S n=1 Tax=Ferrimicrobium acidiphilum TaxID=121039 RepID=UPI0030B87A10
MTDSGIEWIGDVPEGWEISRLKHVTSVEMGQSPPSDSYHQDGTGTSFLQGCADFGEIYPNAVNSTTQPRKYAHVGDILFSVRAPVGAMNVSDKVYAIGRGLCAIQANNPFLWWVLTAQRLQLQAVSTGSTYDAVSVEQVRGLVIMSPPLLEQQAIAAYLDKETAKIDKLIAKKQRLIELSDERRASLISQAVTKGLDPEVPMKDSGIEWIGEMPEHWDVSPFKWHIESNVGGVWGNDPSGTSDTVVLRSTEQTVDGHWTINQPALRQLSLNEKQSALLEEGDLVVTKSSGSSLHIGKTTLVSSELAKLECCYSNFMQRLRMKSSFLPRLAWYVMNNGIVREQLDLSSNSTTGLANINGGTIGQILLAIPPASEQKSLVTYLDKETAKIDKLKELNKRQISLLSEKRQALITDAVTGKIQEAREVA